MVTAAFPSRMRKNPTPRLPSTTTSLPGGKVSSFIERVSLLRSRLDNPESSGTCSGTSDVGAAVRAIWTSLREWGLRAPYVAARAAATGCAAGGSAAVDVQARRDTAG